MGYVQYWRRKFFGCLGISLVIFGLPYLMQESLLSLYGGWNDDAQQRQQLIAFYGLDRSLPEQYGIWLYRMVSGEWGSSRFYNRSVWRDARLAMGQTAILVGWTLLIWVIWIGLWQLICRMRRSAPRARRRSTWLLLIMILPNFVIVILARDLLLWRFGWLSMAHMPAFVPLYLFNPVYMAVPAALLALLPCAVWAVVHPAPTIGRSASLGTSLIRFCRRFQPFLAGMIFEIFLLEQILTMPGLGRLGIAALKRRDIPMLQGFVLCTLILYLVLNFLLDWGAKRRLSPHGLWSRPAGVIPRWPRSQQRHYRGVLGLLVLLAIVVWAPQLMPYDPSEIHSDDQLQRVGYRYFLGTDFLGRDVFSRTLGGSRSEIPRSGLVMIVAGGLSGLLLYLSRHLPRVLSAVVQACGVVYQMLPPFLMIFLLFLVLEPLPWPLELSLVFGFLPLGMHLLSQHRPLRERLLSLAWIGGQALLLLVVFHFLNVIPDVASPTWGSELRMGMTYSQNNAWLLIGPAIAVLGTYYSFCMASLIRIAPQRQPRSASLSTSDYPEPKVL